jgi:hypothetical protein
MFTIRHFLIALTLIPLSLTTLQLPVYSQSQGVTDFKSINDTGVAVLTSKSFGKDLLLAQASTVKATVEVDAKALAEAIKSYNDLLNASQSATKKNVESPATTDKNVERPATTEKKRRAPTRTLKMTYSMLVNLQV